MKMSKKYLIVDSHEDIAENMLTFNRDYSRSVAETRQLEKDTETPNRNGDTLLGWDAYQSGCVAVIFSTIFAAPERHSLGEWNLMCYSTPDEAHALYLNQLAAYNQLVQVHPDKFRLIHTKDHLNSVREMWHKSDKLSESNLTTDEVPIGLVILIEGAEGIRDVNELEMWWESGVRIIGPAWAGTRFSGGTNEPGPLTKEGYALLGAMADIGFALDISHMDDGAALQALDFYPGTIIASHSNAKSLIPNTDSNRFLTDRVIDGLITRGGVAGVVPFNEHLQHGWKDGDDRKEIPLSCVVDQIDYYCQRAGNTQHVGIGTDFDGGFGLQSTPDGIDSISDIQRIAPMLINKGYSESEVQAIFSGNWLRILRVILPKNS
jgi:membrane dipeptidase